MKNSEFIESITNKESFIDNKNFEIEIITPIHIGSGRVLNRGLDFTTSDSHTLIYNINKLISAFGEQQSFIDAITNGTISGFLRENGIPEVEYSRALNGNCDANDLDEFISDGNDNPFIPGSSVKGGIRTAFFEYYFNNNGNGVNNDYKRLLIRSKTWASQRLQEKVLAPKYKRDKIFKSAQNADILRSLRVSDVSFKNNDLCVVNALIMNLKGNDGYDYGWKHLPSKRTNRSMADATSVPVVALKPGVISKSFKLSIDEFILKFVSTKEKNWERFSEILNDHYEDLINKEMDYVEPLPENEETDSIFNQLNYLIDEVADCRKNTANGRVSWIQRIGWGSGWTTMTGGHVPENLLNDVRLQYYLNTNRQGLRYPVFPKTRKIVKGVDNELRMLGWIKVTEEKES